MPSSYLALPTDLPAGCFSLPIFLTRLLPILLFAVYSLSLSPLPSPSLRFLLLLPPLPLLRALAY